MTGDNPFIVFLHEGLGSSEQWKDFPALLSGKSGCPALLYDRLGYGKSESIDKLFDKNFMHYEAFKVLPALLEKLKITGKLVLVGHSDGGTIALLFAARHPEKVAGVITEADHVICEKNTMEGINNIVKNYEHGKLKEKLYKYHKEKTDALFYGWSGFWLSDTAASWNIKEHLSEIKAPVLSVQGKDDKYGSVKQLILKLKLIKSPINIIFLDNCGHIPHFEQKEIVLNKMKNFIFEIINN